VSSTIEIERPPTAANSGLVTVRRVQKFLTLVIVAGPLIGTAACVAALWNREVDITDLVMAFILYVVTGLGMTVGFHRFFTHRSFKAGRWLKITLALLGSMAIEGSVTSWVAAHRRHHMFSDGPGDPHSPHRYGEHGWPLFRGLMYAHVGWLFVDDPSSAERYAPDLLRDSDIDVISRYFPLIAIFSLVLPFGLGFWLSGTLVGGITAFVWAGLVRIALLHHVTWSVNSLCHTFGRQTECTEDRSTNLWPLAILSFGESWHNIHHAHPAWARHGAGRGMVDPSARMIRIFETFGWATSVRWPSAGSPDLSVSRD